LRPRGASFFFTRLRSAGLLLAFTLLATAAHAREYAVGAVPAWVAPVAAPVVAEDDAAGAVRYLLIDHQTRNAGRDSEYFTHFVLQATSEQGIDEAANHDVDFDPAYQALTLNTLTVTRAGKRSSRLESADIRVLAREEDAQNRLYDGSLSVHMLLDDIRVGDVVEVAFTVRGSNPIFDGRDFGAFQLGWTLPVARQHARLLHPAARPLAVRTRNGGVTPRERVLGDMREYVWTRDDAEAIQVEDDAPGWFSNYPSATWTEYADWNAVANWAVPLYVPAQRGGELRGEVERIRAEAKTPEARLLAALRLVQSEVRYLGFEMGTGSYAPRAPDVVFARRFGDCKDKTLLLLSLLHALDVPAHAALVNTQRQRGLDDAPTTPGAFDHVIVRAHAGGRDYWLDPTRSVQRANLDALAQPDFERALVVAPGTKALVAMQPYPSPRRPHRIDVEVDASAGFDKPARITITTTLEGEDAESARDRVAGKRLEDLQKEYLNYYVAYYPGIRVTAPMTREDDLARNRRVITEHYEVPEFWPRKKDAAAIEATVWAPEMESYLSAPSSTMRVAPVGLIAGTEFTQRTVVLLPADWDGANETTTTEDPHFVAERTIEGEGKRYVITDTYRVLKDHVAPEAVPAYAAKLAEARGNVGYVFTRYDDTAQGSFLERFNWTVAMIGVLMLALCGWMARKAYRWDPAPRNELPDPALVGITGWLILPAIGVVVSPPATAWVVFDSIDVYALPTWISLTQPGGEFYNALWAPLLLGELAMNIALFVLALLAAVLFFQRRRSAPLAWIALLLGDIAFNVVDAAGVAVVNPEAVQDSLGNLAKSVLTGSIWITYFLLSQRVRSTFTRGYGDFPAAVLAKHPVPVTAVDPVVESEPAPVRVEPA
jgi:transglutaminase-like putative cysteine protease